MYLTCPLLALCLSLSLPPPSFPPSLPLSFLSFSLPPFPPFWSPLLPTVPLYLWFQCPGTGDVRRRRWSLGGKQATPKAAAAFPSSLSSPSFLFTFGLSNSVGISLWTVKIRYLPRASRRAESEVTNRSEGVLVSVSLFLRAEGRCGHPLNIHCASNLCSSLLTGGRGDTIIPNREKFQVSLIWFGREWQ